MTGIVIIPVPVSTGGDIRWPRWGWALFALATLAACAVGAWLVQRYMDSWGR